MGKDSTENKPASKESKEDKAKSKEPAGALSKSKDSAEEKPKSATSTEEKPKVQTSSSSSKPQATTSVGKDAFGRPSCDVTAEEEVQCHESHKPFQKGYKESTVKETSAKKTSRSFTEVDNEKIGKSSTYSKISEYCQNLVRRQVTVETGTGPAALASGASVVAKRRGRMSFLGQPKRFQLVGRWLPAAGVYMVATAAVAAWVTEWGEVVNRIPYYKVQEEVSKPKPATKSSEPPESPSSSLESSSSTPESSTPASESSTPASESPASASGPES